MDATQRRDHLTQQLNWRYAVKKFDPERKIPPEDWQVLKDALLLAPSSFGLQPWKFAVVTDHGLKLQLVEHSWGQLQPRDCSHLVVLLVRKRIDPDYVDRFMQRTAELRGVPVEKLNGYRSVIVQFIERLTDDQAAVWMSRQVYIALGQLMAAAAVLEIDACPMEGIVSKQYDELLGLKDSDYTTVVACALGYRDGSDYTSSLKKVRFDAQELFLEYPGDA